MKISKKITIAVLLVVVLASLLWYSPYLHENTENTLTLTSTTHSNTTVIHYPGQTMTMKLYRPPYSLVERLKAIISSKNRLGATKIIDAYPWNKAPSSPYPAMPGSIYMPIPNNTLYLEEFLQALEKNEYLHYYSYSLPEGVALTIIETMNNNAKYIIVYSYIDNTTLWARRLAEYTLLTLTLKKTCEQTLAELLRENLTMSEDIILRIPFPWNGTSDQTPVKALAIVEMPILGKNWPEPLRLIQEKMDWVFLASPAIYYCLNKTLSPGISLETIYTDVLPRLVRAIVLPGVTYYPITKTYETPITLRLTGKGVCKDYAYATAFLADSLGLVAVDMFGVDPRTGINHSLSGIIIPSRFHITAKGVQVIKDIDGDDVKEYLVPLTDTAKIPLNLLEKGGFTKNLILDPGIPVTGMDPGRERIDYYWYIQYFIGLDKDYMSLPQPFRPPWTNTTDRLMLLLAHTYDNITSNYTRLALQLVLSGEITSRTFSWFSGKALEENESIDEIYNLSLSNAVLDISSYTPMKWLKVFTELIASRIEAPHLFLQNKEKIGETTKTPEWFWWYIYRHWSIGSIEESPGNIVSNRYLDIIVYPVFHKKTNPASSAENNIYVFAGLYGSKMVNGTTYEVWVVPTNQRGILSIVVKTNNQTYIMMANKTSWFSPIIRIDHPFDNYAGLIIVANRTISYSLEFIVNYTDDRLEVSSTYSKGMLGLKYRLEIKDNMLYFRMNIYSGFPQVLSARITVVYKKGEVKAETLTPIVNVNSST